MISSDTKKKAFAIQALGFFSRFRRMKQKGRALCVWRRRITRRHRCLFASSMTVFYTKKQQMNSLTLFDSKPPVEASSGPPLPNRRETSCLLRRKEKSLRIKCHKITTCAFSGSHGLFWFVRSALRHLPSIFPPTLISAPRPSNLVVSTDRWGSVQACCPCRYRTVSIYAHACLFVASSSSLFHFHIAGHTSTLAAAECQFQLSTEKCP